MPLDGTGQWVPAGSTVNPAVTTTTISSTDWNALLADLKTALSTAMFKDGQATPTANIKMSGFKLTGLAAATAAGDAVRFEQHFTTTALTDQATITWDASLAPVATVTITASRTMAAPSNLKAGGLYGLIVTQNGTGGFSLTWNAVFKAWGSNTMPQPETTAAAISAFAFYSPDGTNLVCLQSVPFVDTNYFVRGSADGTKKVRFEVDNLTTATTRVWTAPDNDLNLAAATANTFLAGPTSGGAGNVTVRAPVGADGASLVLISTAVASNSATVDFTSGITSTFDEYLVTWTNIIPATDVAQFWVRISEDSGSTFKAGGTDYAHTRVIQTDANAPSSSGSTGDAKIIVAAALSNGTTAPFCGELKFWSPSNTTAHKLFKFTAAYLTSAGSVIGSVDGSGTLVLDSNAINGIRFMMGGGNISSGNFALYGIRKS